MTTVEKITITLFAIEVYEYKMTLKMSLLRFYCNAIKSIRFSLKTGLKVL